MPAHTLETLPRELVLSVLDFVPVLDYLNLKLAGSRYITDVVRSATPHLPRGEYCVAISTEDARRKGMRKGFLRPALEITIERNQEALVRHFMQKYQPEAPTGQHEEDANQNKRNQEKERRSYRTALHCAAYYGSVGIVRLLLDHANTRCGRSRETALHIAAMNGQAEVVNLLLANGAEIDALDGYGRTPLQFAIEENQDAVVTLLRSKGAASNLDAAIQSHSNDWLKLLPGDVTKFPKYICLARSRVDPPRRRRNADGVFQAFLEYQLAKSGSDPAERINERRERVMGLAITHGYPAIVSSILDDGIDINKVLGNSRCTPLCLAILHGSNLIVKLLLERGADGAVKCPRGEGTPLHTATRSNNEVAVQLLLDSGFPVDASDSSGETALHQMTKTNGVSVMKYLVDNGANIEARVPQTRRTPLHYAIKHTTCKGAGAAVEYLLEKGADPHARDHKRSTPLHLAAKFGRTEVIHRLLDLGVGVTPKDKKGSSPLHLASDPGVVEALLNRGANVNAINAAGISPLRVALGTKGDESSLKNLLKHGADIRWKDWSGCTLLHAAFLTQWPGVPLEFVDLLLEYGADVHAVNSHGVTPLFLAAETSKVGAVTSLLKKGAKPTATNKQGCTPLHFVFRNKTAPSRVLVKMLVDHGADVNARGELGKTPLHLAVERTGDDHIIKFLFKKGAEVNGKDEKGRTPLHYAIIQTYFGYVEVLELLLNHGALVDAADEDGSTPMDLAIERQLDDRVAILERAKAWSRVGDNRFVK